jgi:hypothetical protein
MFALFFRPLGVTASFLVFLFFCCLPFFAPLWVVSAQSSFQEFFPGVLLQMRTKKKSRPSLLRRS